MRALYNWTIGLADKKYAAWALFIIAFAESSFFPIPPDVLLIALGFGMTNRSFRFALISLAGSTLGAVVGYAIGYFLWYTGGEFSALAQTFFHYIPGFSPEAFSTMQGHYEKWDFWIIFTAGFTPIPFKLFTISAGTFNIDVMAFFLATLVSRGARFFLIAALIYRFGESIREFIERYFNLVVTLFTILLIGGFVLLKFIF